MNHPHINVNDTRFSRFCVIIGALILSTLVSGCFQNYGRIKRNPEVTQAFQNNQITQNYKYYYYGLTNWPYAIVGIDPAYHMRSKVWREVDPNTEQFKKMVFWAWGDYYLPSTLGADILSPTGEKVGVWYSSIWFVAIRFEEGNRIEVMPDTPFIRGPR